MIPQNLTQKTVCVVRFNNPLTQNDVRPGIFYQVTVDPTAISPSGRFIRFGPNPGDEIVGWQRIDWMVIEEVLGVWTDPNQPPVLEYKQDSVGVPFMTDDVVRLDSNQFVK